MFYKISGHTHSQFCIVGVLLTNQTLGGVLYLLPTALNAGLFSVNPVGHKPETKRFLIFLKNYHKTPAPHTFPRNTHTLIKVPVKHKLLHELNVELNVTLLTSVVHVPP